MLAGFVLSLVLLGHAGLQIARAFPPELRAAASDALRRRPRLATVTAVTSAWFLTYALYSLAYPPDPAITDVGRGAPQEFVAQDSPLESAAATAAEPVAAAPSPAVEVPLLDTTPVGPIASDTPPTSPAPEPAPEPAPAPADPAPPPPDEQPASDPCTEAIAAGDVAALAAAVEAGCQRSES